MSQEMKSLVRGFVRWVILVGITLNVILWGLIIAHCQDIHPRHDTQESVEDEMGFITVHFLSKDKRLIYWKRETKNEIKLSSFGYDDYTRFELIDKDKLSGKLCVIYCKTHLFAYLITKCKE